MVAISMIVETSAKENALKDTAEFLSEEGASILFNQWLRRNEKHLTAGIRRARR
jgi:hypothetical protein